MSPCILVTSHINNSEKIKVAHKLIDFLQDKKLPVIFAGNFPIPIEIQQKVDYTLNIKENPLPNRWALFWNQVLTSMGWGENTYMEYKSWDYGYAHLHQICKGVKLCQSLGYDYVYHLNYDIEFTEENFNKFINRGKKGNPLFFPWGGKDNFATNIFALPCNLYVNSIEPTLHLYQEGTFEDPDLKKGWFCESFFKWAIEKHSKQKFYHTTDIPFSANYYHLDGKFSLGDSLVDIYFHPEKEVFLFWKKKGEIENLCKLEHEDGSNHLLKPTSIPYYFILESNKEGNYYYKGDLVFTNSLSFKSDNYITHK